MTEAYYPGITAGDAASIQPDGTVIAATVQPNSFMQVFELSDTAYTTPLTIRSESGLTDTKVPVGALPILPDVYVQSPNFSHKWKSGDLVFRRDSSDAKDKAVADAVAAAQLASTNAAAAAEAELAARIAVGEFNGLPGRDGSNVVPTAEAIAAEIQTPGTPANTALSATFAVQPDNGGKPVGKGELSLNVRDYGAKGDGVTDDTAAIQAAFDAATVFGATVILPPGDHVVSNNGPRMSSHTRFVGTPGKSRIVSLVATGANIFRCSSLTGGVIYNAHVEGITFYYPAKAAARTGGEAVRFSSVIGGSIKNCQIINSTSAGLALNMVEDFVCEGNLVQNTWADGIIADNGSGTTATTVSIKNLIIRGNTVRLAGDDAITVLARYTSGRRIAKDVLVQGNFVDTTTPLGGGIAIYGVDGCDVSGNIIHNAKGHGIAVCSFAGSNVWGSRNVRVSNNTITSDLTDFTDNTRNAIRLGGTLGGGAGAEDPGPLHRDVTIESNTIIVSDRTGIFCSMHSAFNTGENRWPVNTTIKNNKMVFVGTSDLNIRGMYFQYTNGLNISGNEIVGFPGEGIGINSHLRTTFTDNEIRNCVTSAAQAGNAIIAIGGSNYANDSLADFSRNRIVKHAGTVSRALTIGRNGTTLGAFAYADNVLDLDGLTITGGNPESFTSNPTLLQRVRLPQQFTGNVGFYGTTPIAKPTGTPPAGTDAATTQALVNDLRAKLIALGLIA